MKKTQASPAASPAKVNAKKTAAAPKDVVITVRGSDDKKTVKVVKKQGGTIDPHNIVISVAAPRDPVKKAPVTADQSRAKRAAQAKQEVQAKREVIQKAGRAKQTAAVTGGSLAQRFSQMATD